MSSKNVALDQITIAALYWESVAVFNRLFDHFKAASRDPPDTLPDDFGRLRVWAENVAAHRRGFMSLDHRLREASLVKEMVKGLPMELNNVLEETFGMALEEAEAKDIEQNISKPETTEPPTVDSEIDDEIRFTSPFTEAVKEIGNIVACLYRLSITIQSPDSLLREY